MMTKRLIVRAAVMLAVPALFTAGCNLKAESDRFSQQGIHMQQEQAQQSQNHIIETTDNRVQIAELASVRIAELNGVHRATVLITGMNAYVAATLQGNQTQVSGELEQRIAHEVRMVNPSTEQVFVSNKPDFIQLVDGYVSNVRQGHSVDGFAETFNEAVKQTFSSAK